PSRPRSLLRIGSASPARPLPRRRRRPARAEEVYAKPRRPRPCATRWHRRRPRASRRTPERRRRARSFPTSRERALAREEVAVLLLHERILQHPRPELGAEALHLLGVPSRDVRGLARILL